MLALGIRNSNSAFWSTQKACCNFTSTVTLWMLRNMIVSTVMVMIGIKKEVFAKLKFSLGVIFHYKYHVSKTHIIVFNFSFPLSSSDHYNVQFHKWGFQLEVVANPCGTLFSKGPLESGLKNSRNIVLSWLPHLVINVNGAANQLETWSYIYCYN